MARISTYALDTDIKGTDKLIGTDVENNSVTKNFTVSDLTAFIAENQPSDLDLVGVNLEWDTQRNDLNYNYGSKRGFTLRSNGSSVNVTVPKLHMEFENLVLEPDSTYEVVIERFRKGRKKGDPTSGNDGYKTSGYKIADPGYADAPYNLRPASLPITNPAGDFYDFKFDYYFRDNMFPEPTGYSLPTVESNTRRVPIGFRIKKTTNGVVKYSHTIRKINLLANASDQLPECNTISFSEM